MRRGSKLKCVQPERQAGSLNTEGPQAAAEQLTDSTEAGCALPSIDAAQEATASVPAMLAFLTQQPQTSESRSPRLRATATATPQPGTASVTGKILAKPTQCRHTKRAHVSFVTTNTADV